MMKLLVIFATVCWVLPNRTLEFSAHFLQVTSLIPHFLLCLFSFFFFRICSSEDLFLFFRKSWRAKEGNGIIRLRWRWRHFLFKLEWIVNLSNFMTRGKIAISRVKNNKLKHSFTRQRERKSCHVYVSYVKIANGPRQIRPKY